MKKAKQIKLVKDRGAVRVENNGKGFLYVGNRAVTPQTGYPIAPGDSLQIVGPLCTPLYGVRE